MTLLQKSIFSKIFSAFSSQPPDDDIRAETNSFCLNSIFIKLPSIYLFLRYLFLEGFKRDPKMKGKLEQFMNFFENFKSPWLPRINNSLVIKDMCACATIAHANL